MNCLFRSFKPLLGSLSLSASASACSSAAASAARPEIDGKTSIESVARGALVFAGSCRPLRQRMASRNKVAKSDLVLMLLKRDFGLHGDNFRDSRVFEEL